MSNYKKIRDHYERRISPQRENFDIVNWASKGSQVKRFRVLADAGDLQGASLLDVGSGLGDLYGFLKAEKIGADYTGVDISEPMVAQARQHYPDGNFLCADLFHPDKPQPFANESFDVVFCSGTFNLNIGNNEKFLAIALPRLLELTRRNMVVNLLHSRRPIYDERYFNYDPAAVTALLTPLPCEVQIIDQYLPNDFTIVCTKSS